MAKSKQRPERLTLPHARTFDYREVYADGTLNRIEGQHVILTFFINDSVVEAEEMELIERGETVSTYKPVRVQENRQRLDLLSVRIPVSEMLAAADMVNSKLTSNRDADSGQRE